MARATAVFAGLTILLTWPQVIQLGATSTHVDGLFNLWRLAWIAHALGGGHNLFDANIFWPERDTFAYSDAMMLEGLIGAPLIWAGVPTAVALNILLLASFVVSGLATWAVVRHLTGSSGAGLVAGVIFAFAPFRFDHYGHFELLWSAFMPLAVLALIRAFENGSARWALAVGGLLALQTLSSIYFGLFLAVVLAAMAIVFLVTRPRAVTRRTIAGFAGGGLLAAALLVPYAQPYHRAKERVGARSDKLVQYYSAGPTHYLSATPDNWLYGRVADATGRHEKRLFPGLLACVLALAGLWPPFDRRRVAVAAGLVVAVDLSFGANGFLLPALRASTEAFQGLRVPARAGQVAILFVAMFAGFGVSRLERWRARRGGAAAPLIAVAIGVLALEYATMPVPLRAAPEAMPVSTWLATQPEGAVAGLPLPTHPTMPGHDMELMYQSTFHWHPLVNGSSGNDSPEYYKLMDVLHGVPTDAGMDELRRLRVRYVILHERWYGTEMYRAVADALSRRTDVQLRGVFPDGTFQTAAYELIK